MKRRCVCNAILGIVVVRISLYMDGLRSGESKATYASGVVIKDSHSRKAIWISAADWTCWLDPVTDLTPSSNIAPRTSPQLALGLRRVTVERTHLSRPQPKCVWCVFRGTHVWSMDAAGWLLVLTATTFVSSDEPPQWSSTRTAVLVEFRLLSTQLLYTFARFGNTSDNVNLCVCVCLQNILGLFVRNVWSPIEVPQKKPPNTTNKNLSPLSRTLFLAQTTVEAGMTSHS